MNINYCKTIELYKQEKKYKKLQIVENYIKKNNRLNKC